MKQDFSYGIIPLRLHDGQWEVLLVQHKSGGYWWAFPKGHAEAGESPEKAAERELLEETGLSVSRLLSPVPLTETYIFTYQGERIFKTVLYFLAIVEGKVLIQESEIEASQWLPLDKAETVVTFKEAQQICRQVIKLINTFS